MRYLAVDPGGKRMGLAIGDDQTAISTALEVVIYGGARNAAGLIAEACIRHGADRVVIGLPVDVEGRETPACARSHAIADQLRALGLHVEMQSEFLSSNEARRRARNAGLSRNKPLDHIAAQVVLEEFLAGLPRDNGGDG